MAFSRSFNPCFGGCRSESQCGATRLDVIRQFQSLFSWMSLWKPPEVRGDGMGDVVSILVLVDVALKGCWNMLYILSDGRFNPFFRGCRSESILHQSPYERRLRFNPCFRGCRSERHTFLYRILLLYRSFNPCFRGCRSERITYPFMKNQITEFQSLFSWMSLWKDCCRDEIPACFSVSILVLVDVALKESYNNPVFRMEWVSILVLVDVALKGVSLPLFVEEQLVSILVLVDVALKAFAIFCMMKPHSSFNPCFGGCRSESGQIGSIHLHSDPVSILVLVDVALKGPCWPE